jgi:RNA polymerase sigma-70 factor (ECF subfamily)
MHDENDLIRAAAAGDRSAFELLVGLKRQQVVRTAYQVTGDLEDALDVAQGVFLKLWQALGRFDPSRRFDTWLYRITVNAAIDLLRVRGPKGVLQPLPDDLAVPAATDVESDVDLIRLQRAFLRLAARLAPKQRTAFVLREIEGLPTAEVAQVMGVAESTVRNHLLQARRVIKAGLEQDYPEFVSPKRSVARANDADEADGADEADAPTDRPDEDD